MSPFNFIALNSSAGVFLVWTYGAPNRNGVDWNEPGVRPVINLDKNVTISSGDGTIDNPYVVGA